MHENVTAVVSIDPSECIYYREMISKINYYFRNEIVLNGTEHSSKELGYVITAVYILVTLFGSIGNLLTVTVVVLNPAMRTTRNFFILNLALSDFVVCTVTAPTTLYTVLYMFWPFGKTLCKIAGSLQAFNVFLSTFSIAAIALDRYVLVIFPTERDHQQKLAIVFFLFIWLASFFFAIPLAYASGLNAIYTDDGCEIVVEMCQEQNNIWTQEMIISKRAYTLSMLVIQYAFPLISIVFAYSSIAHRMRMRIANRY